MRCANVSVIKGEKNGFPRHAVPAEGTKLRSLYDLFMCRKGEVLEDAISVRLKGNGRALADLRDYYGLDIRCIGYRQWVLAGEWFGRVYVDYIAERIRGDSGMTRRVSLTGISTDAPGRGDTQYFAGNSKSLSPCLAGRALLKRGYVAQALIDSTAVLFCFLFVISVALSLPLALFLLLFAKF